ncbi:MAG TPA: DNA-binding transcriptional regulator [Pirellulales bacterium]|jgi:LacI family transcriptional regulator|nr:DNA-binding transcriptional regulator [Pirellulales bacterium]
MTKRPQVALLIERSNAYARGLLRGIYAYLRDHRPWSIYLADQGLDDSPPPNWLKNWRGHGIIARSVTPRIAKAVRAAGVPAIDVSGSRLFPDLPCVETDNEAVSRLVFDHLAQRGFRHLAFCGEDRFAWSNERRHWFTQFAEQAGCRLEIYPPPDRRGRKLMSWQQEEKQLADWIRHLRRPCGMMACNDLRGWRVLEVCRQIGVRVPDEIAVVGVDNDELLCNLTEPPLSSVIPDTLRIGYETAQLLDEMMRGRKAGETLRLIKPVGLVTRHSSDVLAVADPQVSAALRFIREHGAEGIKVDDVLAAVQTSRSILDGRFKKAVGRTPHEEILRIQLQRVKQLLEESDLPLAAIAARTGFKHAEYLSVAFKREVGTAPGEYRVQCKQ